jgi:hypothetical protein
MVVNEGTGGTGEAGKSAYEPPRVMPLGVRGEAAGAPSCGDGSSAAADCYTGSSARACIRGNSALYGCDTGSGG